MTHFDNPSKIRKEPRLIGFWFSLVANGIAACGGAIFFFATPGGRYRGMEPEAEFFIAFALLGALVGLIAGFPLSLRDLIWRRQWLWGTVGIVLAFTPLFTAALISDFAAWQMNLIWD